MNKQKMIEAKFNEELTRMRQKIAQLEASEAALIQAEEELRKSEERYRSFVAATSQVMWTTNAKREIETDLPRWRKITGQTLEEIQGWGWLSAIHPDDRDSSDKAWLKAIESKDAYKTEYRVRKYDGTYRFMVVQGIPILEKDGAIREWVGTCTDVTEHKLAEEELQKAQERIVQAAREIMEISNPIVTVFDDVIAVPIIGTLDSARTQRIMESLLQSVVDYQARVVIMDITGVPVVDTLTATHLLKTANAVRLLGAVAIVTGISPKIAQTLVTLGVDLSEMMTRSRMVDGIKSALKILDKTIINNKKIAYD